MIAGAGILVEWLLRAASWVLAAASAPLFLDLLLVLPGNALVGARRRGARGTNATNRRTVMPTAAAPRLAAVIPAHNEEQLTGRAVRSLLSEDPGLAVFVVAHNCSDATAATAREAGARVLVLDDENARGKAAALRHGFDHAAKTGFEALLVIDADSYTDGRVVRSTEQALAAGAMATQCRYEQGMVPGVSPSTGQRLRMMAFRGMNVLRGRGREGLGLSSGIFGNGFALRVELLNRLPYSADSIAEDLEYHALLVGAGYRVSWLDDARVFAELAPAGGAQQRQQARWEGGRLRVASLVSGRLAAAALGGKGSAAETLLDVWSLPLSRGLAAALVCVLVPGRWTQAYGLAALAVAASYVVGLIALGSEPGHEALAVLGAPAFVARKLMQTGLVVKQAQKDADWVKTKRGQSEG